MFQKIMILRKKWNIPCFRRRIPELMYQKLPYGMFHIPEWNSMFI